MKYIIYILILLIAGLSSVSTQITVPYSQHISFLKNSEVLRVIDYKYGMNQQVTPPESGFKKANIASVIELSFSPGNSGNWYRTDTADVWHMGISIKQARALALFFNAFKLKPGVQLFIYNSNMSQVIGALGIHNNKASGVLTTNYIKGTTMYLQMIVPARLYKRFGQLSVAEVSVMPAVSSGELKSVNTYYCNTDVNCYDNETIRTKRDAVCAIYINGRQECTGTLINNTSNNGKPYVLTANHCISDSSTAAHSLFVFGLESTDCNCENLNTQHSISGATLLATKREVDMSLVELSETPPIEFRPVYLGWDKRSKSLLNGKTIHQPDGMNKSYSADYDPLNIVTADIQNAVYLAENAHYMVERWDIGTTIGGASGAPLFDTAGSIVGFLSGGYADCYDPTGDYFARFSMAWDYSAKRSEQLKTWLDPSNTGIQVLGDYNPFNISPFVKYCESVHVNLSQKNQMKIFPNPVSNTLNITNINTGNTMLLLHIYNVQGQLRLSKKLEVQNGEVSIDVSGLESGVYTIHNQAENSFYKVVKL